MSRSSLAKGHIYAAPAAVSSSSSYCPSTCWPHSRGEASATRDWGRWATQFKVRSTTPRVSRDGHLPTVTTQIDTFLPPVSAVSGCTSLACCKSWGLSRKWYVECGAGEEGWLPGHHHDTHQYLAARWPSQDPHRWHSLFPPLVSPSDLSRSASVTELISYLAATRSN